MGRGGRVGWGGGYGTHTDTDTNGLHAASSGPRPVPHLSDKITVCPNVATRCRDIKGGGTWWGGGRGADILRAAKGRQSSCPSRIGAAFVVHFIKFSVGGGGGELRGGR